MTNPRLTVDVQSLEPFNALKMTWAHDIKPDEVRVAFKKIQDALDRAQEPIFVVVDIQNNPKFPMRATLEAARGPYSSPMLGAWLIVGTNLMAHSIERTLSMFTNRRNVHWFHSENEAVAYLKLKSPVALQADA